MKVETFLPTLLGLLLSGCSEPKVTVMRFDDLPEIANITTVKSDLLCDVLSLDTSQMRRICVFPRLRKDQSLKTLLPSLEDEEPFEGADTLNGRIPEALKRSIGHADIFIETDIYWIFGIQTERGRVFSIYAAQAGETPKCYFEYSYEI